MILPKVKKYVSNYVVIFRSNFSLKFIRSANVSSNHQQKNSNHCEERFENLLTKTLQDETEHKTVHRAISLQTTIHM